MQYGCFVSVAETAAHPTIQEQLPAAAIREIILSSLCYCTKPMSKTTSCDSEGDWGSECISSTLLFFLNVLQSESYPLFSFPW